MNEELEKFTARYVSPRIVTGLNPTVHVQATDDPSGRDGWHDISKSLAGMEVLVNRDGGGHYISVELAGALFWYPTRLEIRDPVVDAPPDPAVLAALESHILAERSDVSPARRAVLEQSAPKMFRCVPEHMAADVVNFQLGYGDAVAYRYTGRNLIPGLRRFRNVEREIALRHDERPAVA